MSEVEKLKKKISELEKEIFALKKVIEEYRLNPQKHYEYIQIPYLIPNKELNPYTKPYEIWC